MREIKFKAWDGDDSISHKDGEYTYVKAEWHPDANKRGYVKRHRLVLEAHMNRYLPKNAIVHHKNGDKRDDRIENLEYHPDQRFHAKHHDVGERNENNQFVASDPSFSQIKFRLFNKHTRLMEIHTLAYLIKTTFRNSQFEFRGRFTGLHDKNGKEIYEGDVITSPSVGNLKQGSVEWGTCGFVVREQGVHGSKDGTWTEVLSSWAYPLDGQGALRGEIIGNIYENPDLLSTASSTD